MAVKFRPDMRSEDYFSPDYATASRRFRSKALENGACLERIELDVNVPNGDALGIDIAWIGAQRPRRVLVHSSGLHGVEGFAGSAIVSEAREPMICFPR